MIVALIIIIIIDNRGLNARWCLTPLLLSLPTAAYLGQRGLTMIVALRMLKTLQCWNRGKDGSKASNANQLKMHQNIEKLRKQSSKRDNRHMRSVMSHHQHTTYKAIVSKKLKIMLRQVNQ